MQQNMHATALVTYIRRHIRFTPFRSLYLWGLGRQTVPIMPHAIFVCLSYQSNLKCTKNPLADLSVQLALLLTKLTILSYGFYNCFYNCF